MRVKVLATVALALALAPAAHAVEWSRATVAATDALGTTELQIEANARGEAVIAYRGLPDSGHLNVVRRDARGRFAAPQTLSHAFWHARDVAIGADGRAYAVWLDESDDEDDDVAMRILFAEAAPGERFGPPVEIAGLFGEWPTLLHIEETAGQVVIAFPYRDAMQVVTRRPGQPFAPPITFDGVWGHGALGANDRGDAVVAWYRGNDAVVGVHVRDGRAGAEQRLAPAGKVGHLRIGLGDGGSMLATWHATYDEDAEADRYYGTIAGAAAPGGAFTVERAPESSRSGPQKPELAVAADGSGVVTWHQVVRPVNVRFATTGRVQAARLSRSGRRGKPQTLSAARAVSTEPRVAIDGRRRTAVVWHQVPRDSLERPVRLMVSTAARGRRFGDPRTLVEPAERARAHALAAHDRGFLLAYVKRRGRNRGTIVVRSGR